MTYRLAIDYGTCHSRQSWVKILNKIKEHLFLRSAIFFYLDGNHMFKNNNRNTGTRCEICLNRSGIFIFNFEHISHLVLVFLLLSLSR